MKKLFFLIISALFFSGPAFAQNGIEPPLITVTGQAEVRVAPDEVVFTLQIENVDRDLLVANKRTDDSVKEILSVARKNNIKPEDIQTSQISVQPKYNTDDIEYSERSKVKRVLVGYEVSKTVGVRLRDISRLEALLADVFRVGITRLSNLTFRDSQIRKHRDQARALAIRAAQEKANLLAREIGQTIGPAYAISEDSQSSYSSSNINQTTVSTDREGASDRESESAIAPGSISITAQVTVRFKLQ